MRIAAIRRWSRINLRKDHVPCPGRRARGDPPASAGVSGGAYPGGYRRVATVLRYNQRGGLCPGTSDRTSAARGYDADPYIQYDTLFQWNVPTPTSLQIFEAVKGGGQIVPGPLGAKLKLIPTSTPNMAGGANLARLIDSSCFGGME